MTKHKKKQSKTKDKVVTQRAPKKSAPVKKQSITEMAMDLYGALPDDESDAEVLLTDSQAAPALHKENTQKKPKKQILGQPELKPKEHHTETKPAKDIQTSITEVEDLPELDVVLTEYEEYILEFLKKSNKPLRLDSILRATKTPRRDKEDLDGALWSLQEKGLIVRIRGAWSSASRLKQSTGTLQMQKAGMGFVIQPIPGSRDIFVHPANMGDALHGDTVRVVMLPVPKGAKPEGRIVAILSRSKQEQGLVAQKRLRPGLWLCVPGNARIAALFEVDTSDISGTVRIGDLLLANVLDKKAPGVFTAKATTNLAAEETPSAQERLAKNNHNIPTEFTPQVVTEAKNLPKDPKDTDFMHRADLRHLNFVTIDGEDAKDFDDAIYVEAIELPSLSRPEYSGQYVPSGQKPQKAQFRLLVAIADVSHYARAGSAMDASAFLRGNSYYFPLSVEPMFPEELSNGLCSLRPNVPRLVMVADMLYTKDAALAGASFYPAVITSKARLTYNEVKNALLEECQETRQKISQVMPMLEEALTLARGIAKARVQRGSLDFDLPESRILFNDQGEISGITKRERNFAHQLIEEFMVAANEAVASYLTAGNQALLYRIHPLPSPEKLTALMNFLGQTGLFTDLLAGIVQKNKKKTPPPISATTLQQIMNRVHGTPQAYTVNRMILRSLMQAQYSTENEEHFGLASKCYCHFTSPIRRYADLTVHRNLKAALGMPGFDPVSEVNLEHTAGHINTTERDAIEAEREVQKRMTILFLRDKTGQEFQGIISGVTDFGMFVELPELLIEGMVRLSSLHDDYYELWAERQELRGRNTGRTFGVGQNVTVSLTDVSLERLEINLQLLQDETPSTKLKPRKKRS